MMLSSGLGLAADQLVGVRDADDFLDAGIVLEDLGIGCPWLAGDADGRAVARPGWGEP